MIFFPWIAFIFLWEKIGKKEKEKKRKRKKKRKEKEKEKRGYKKETRIVAI